MVPKHTMKLVFLVAMKITSEASPLRLENSFTTLIFNASPKLQSIDPIHIDQSFILCFQHKRHPKSSFTEAFFLHIQIMFSKKHFLNHLQYQPDRNMVSFQGERAHSSSQNNTGPPRNTHYTKEDLFTTQAAHGIYSKLVIQASNS